MNHLRNLHNPIPCGVGYRGCHGFGIQVAEKLGHVHGTDLDALFKRLGGSFDNVWDTFGRDDDQYVYTNRLSWTVTEKHGIEQPWYSGVRNEILAQGIAHLMLHFPLVLKAHGPDAAMAVSRYKRLPEEETALREAIQFMIGFLIPDDAAEGLFISGYDDEAVAKAFGVTVRLAEKRRIAVMKPRPDPKQDKGPQHVPITERVLESA